MNFILKIVEGPNKGAEIALVEGVSVTLGKGDDCDIVLADSTLPDEPLVIEASGVGVSVGGEVIEPLNVKTVGATSFAVGPADAPWGELVWPKADVPEKLEKLEKPDGPETPEKPKTPETPPAPAKVKRRGCLGCLVALLLLLLVLAVLVWFFRSDPRVEKVKSRVSGVYETVMSRFAGDSGKTEESGNSGNRPPEESLASLASLHGLELSGRDGVFSLSGNFKTRRERLAATAEAYGAMPGISLDLSDDESFRASVEDALFTLTEGALKVTAATNRCVAITGVSPSPAALKRALEALNADIPKIKSADVSGVRFGIVPTAAAAGGSGASGVSDPGVSRKVARKARNPPSVPVCGILTTPYPCIVMRDGRRLMEGAAIGDGVIAEIGADYVTLTNTTGRFTWKP